MKKNEEKERRMQLRRGLGNRRVEVSAEWLRQPSTRYLVAHACFLCRKSFKLERSDTRVRACPDCGGQAYEMGRSFKAPARSDIKQWKKVQVLFAHGFRFFSYRTYECAPLPDRLSRSTSSFVPTQIIHFAWLTLVRNCFLMGSRVCPTSRCKWTALCAVAERQGR